jgi:IPT/TIG domain
VRNQGARLPQEACDDLGAILETYERLAVTSTQPHAGADAEIATLKTRLASNDALWWTDIAQAQLCVVVVLGDDDVRAQLRSWRRRFQEVAGDARYASYSEGAPSLTTATSAVLRADLSTCIQAVYYFYATYGVAARSRSEVTLATLQVAGVILAIEAVLGVLIAVAATRPIWPFTLTPDPVGVLKTLEFLLATSAVAVVGSVVSVQRRLQDPSVDVDPFYRYIQTKGDWLSISVISPLSGAIFGFVLYGLLASKLIAGTIVDLSAGYPAGTVAVALLLVFGFVAGFAEQLVPDALTRIANRVLGGADGANGAKAATSASGQLKSGPIALGGGPAAPSVTMIAPATGPAAGGTVVTITGSGLAGLTGVTFGGTAATAFSATSDTQATATSPAGTSGATVDVIVAGPNGSSPASAAAQFTYT